MGWVSLSILLDCFCSERWDTVTVTLIMAMAGPRLKVTVRDLKKMIHRIPRSKARKKAKG